MNKYLLLKITSVLIAALSQVLLKQEANKTHNNLIKEYLNFNVIVAYLIFALSTVLSIFSLKGITIGYSMIIEALNFILVPLLGYCLFKENINQKQIIGIALIVIGMIIYNI